MKKGAIFDQDGLMFDTESIWQESWKTIAAFFGEEVPADFPKAVCGSSGELMIQIVSSYFPRLDAKEYIRQVRERTHEEQKKHLEAKTGLYELIQFLHENQIPMIVASSSHKDSIALNLKNAGIETFFQDIVSGQDVKEGKPAPDIFLLAAQKLGLSPEDCYVLEDSYNGVLAGHRAGCFTIMVPDLIKPDENISKVYDVCCSSLLEVRDRMQAGEF